MHLLCEFHYTLLLSLLHVCSAGLCDPYCSYISQAKNQRFYIFSAWSKIECVLVYMWLCVHWTTIGHH